MLTQIQTDLLDFGEIQLLPVSQYTVDVSQQLRKQKQELRNLCGLSHLLVLVLCSCVQPLSQTDCQEKKKASSGRS